MASKRFAAFLRGVTPTNARMPELKAAFEAAGFTDVATVIASGNVVFSARSGSVKALARRAEKAMEETLGRTFLTFVRPVDALRELVAEDPYSSSRLPPGAKRVVTFLAEPPPTTMALPLKVDTTTILAVNGCDVFTAYVPGAKGGAFMIVLEKAFGKDVTTRTWDTVKRVAR